MTAHHYVGTDEAILRKHMQKVTDRILELVGATIAKSAKIVTERKAE